MTARGRRRGGADPRTGAHRVTLAEVAREAGVSLATASRAINGSTTRSVTPALESKVLAAAERLRYSPDTTAQSMARGRTTTLGLIVHEIADPYFSTIAAGITEAAEKAGLAVTLASTHHDPGRELQLLETMKSLRPCAIVIVGGRRDDSEASERLRRSIVDYQRTGGLVAMVSQPLSGVSTVQIDNYGGSAALAERLHDLGYRRFGLLAGPTAHLTARDRTAGFRAGLAARGVGLAHGAVLECDFTRDGGFSGMTELLQNGPEVELVFAVNDVMAVGAMAAARGAGLRLPADLSFAGFDNIPTLRDTAPALTTVDIPLPEIGRAATELALSSSPSATPRITSISGEVLLRESTPRRPSSG